MSVLSKIAAVIFAPVTAGGVPRGADMADCLIWGTEIEQLLNAVVQGGSAAVFETRAQLNVSLAYPANSMSWVMNDPIAAYNGIYRKVGGSGSGSWTRIADLPYSWVRMIDAGAGTANAIQVTSVMPTSASMLRIANVVDANTGNVTLSENGAAPKPLLTATGNQISAGGLPGNAIVMYFDDGTNFRLLSDQASIAVLQAAENALAQAEGALTTLVDPRFSTHADAAAFVPIVAPEFILTAGQTNPADYGGSLYRKATGGDRVDLTITQTNALAVNYIRKNLYVTPQMCGAIAGSNTDQDTILAAAAKAAIEDDVPLIINGAFRADVIDMSGVASGGRLRVRLDGKLTHVNSSSGDMFNLGTRDYVEFIGGGEIDGNKNNQSANRLIIPVANVASFYLKGLTFKNLKQGAVHQQNPATSSFIMEDFSCLEGGLHDGIASSQYCYFVLLRAGKYNRVSRFRMVQTADPAANTNRNPAGVMYINTGSDAPSERVVIEDGYLENLGHSSAGNHVGSVDFYSRAEVIDLSRLTIRKPRFLPIRTNYGKAIRISGCDIDAPYQQYQNDTTAFTEATCISVASVDRGYATDQGDIDNALIENNKIRIYNTQNCHGISVVSSDPDFFFWNAVLSNNRLQNLGTNTFFGIYNEKVVNVEDISNILNGFSIGRRSQGHSTSGHQVATTYAQHVVYGGQTLGGANGIVSSSNVTNLHLSVRDHTFSGQSTAPYNLGALARVLFDGCRFNGGTAVISSTAAFFELNSIGGGTPTGIGSATYYRIRNCVGRADAQAGT